MVALALGWRGRRRAHDGTVAVAAGTRKRRPARVAGSCEKRPAADAIYRAVRDPEMDVQRVVGAPFDAPPWNPNGKHSSR